MPLRDPIKREIAQRRRLYVKICRNCGAKNPPKAERCRKCRSSNLRWKHREPMGRR
ncbi:50S ribosomal protein L40e [Candidatus Bathyarchaeota archaeon]|nr:MAG: 50S ribosomal protein L40e [Candidatus Bathyarchaeota archaeon]